MLKKAWSLVARSACGVKDFVVNHKRVFSLGLVGGAATLAAPSTASAQIVPVDLALDPSGVVAALGTAMTPIIAAAFTRLIAIVVFRFLWGMTRRGAR